MVEKILDLIAVFFHSQWGFIAFIAVSVLLIYSLSRHRKVFLIALILALLLSSGLKVFLNQERPCVSVDSQISCPESNGFPSNHAVLASISALGAWGTILFAPYLIIAFVIALSRVWIGVHTVDQVAGGFAFGVMIFLAVWQVHEKFFGRKEKYDLDALFEENLLTKTYRD